MSTRWLLALVDLESGGVPNLGPNDGAYIQPLTICPFQDFRPVLQAAGIAFMSQRAFPPGIWDELSLWLGDLGQEERQHPSKSTPHSITPHSLIPNSLTPNFFLTPHLLRIPSHKSWAYFRVARFNSRPGHADQLHLDLWWRGINLAQDAGTYSYNAPPPWDNSLSRTCVHNTLTVNGQDQMIRAGRFLWLDWAQAQIMEHKKAPDGAWERLVAGHDGYRRLGLLHQRAVTAFHDGRWQVEDTLLKVGRLKVGDSQGNDPTFNLQPSTCNLYWLLPDWEWEIGEILEKRVDIRLMSPFGWIVVGINTGERARLGAIQLVRAGKVLAGSGEAAPFMGWVSPAYGQKKPALSLTITTTGSPPFSLTTDWLLPPDKDGH
jgi:hypothetical protein